MADADQSRRGTGAEARSLRTPQGRADRILGARRDGPLARLLAEAGARIVTSVGTTSTMLVIGNERPFGRFVNAGLAYRRAEDLRRDGRPIEIVAEHELKTRLGI